MGLSSRHFEKLFEENPVKLWDVVGSSIKISLSIPKLFGGAADAAASAILTSK